MVFDNATIDIAYVVDSNAEKGFITVALDEADSSTITDQIFARLINPFNNTEVMPPKTGAKGLIIRRNKQNKYQTFWLGTISEPNDNAHDSNADATQLKHGTSKVQISDDGFVVKNNGGTITQDKNNFQVTQGTSEINLNNNEAILAIKDSSNITSTLGQLHVSKSGASLFSQGTVNLE